GTRDWAVTACIGDAIDFQKAVGPERIEKRGRQLMDYFKREVQQIKDVTLHTSMDPRMSCLLAAVSIRDIPHGEIIGYLRKQYKIISRPVAYDLNAVRFSAHYFNMYDELDIALHGLREVAEGNVLGK
ncbi:MAG: hypothetical protein MI919_24430, partial [Holophagales bacterium]|nr:hypothetical protein [Holophagales bacterium]